jgi:predicted dehydrogenase
VKDKKVNRRQFLKNAGAAAAAMSFPYIVPSSVKAAKFSPGNRITLGCIGVGKQGTFLEEAFLNEPGAEVVAVCDVDTLKLQRGKNLAEKYYAEHKPAGAYKGCAAYKDFRELLARDDIDGVVVATPDHWHAIIAVQAARAGKDIYCEKPISQTVAEAREMVKVVKNYGRIFQTGSMQRSDSRFRFVCELVRNGYIGEVKTITAGMSGPPDECDLPAEAVPDYLDWDMWLGPAPKRPYNEVLSPHISKDHFPLWRIYLDYGGGYTTDWGAHHFDIAQWALGMDRSGPVEIYPPDGKNELIFKYANGTILTRQEPKEWKDYTVTFDGTEGKIVVHREFLNTQPESLADVKLGPNDIRLYKSNNHYANWLDCIRTRGKPICDVETGCQTTIVCHIGNIAYELNRPLKWDPEKVRFVGDLQADRLLSRSMRSPWHL